VANLLLVRAETRERALAMQSALGASRNRLVVAFLAESVSLGLMGGILGTGLAWAGLRFLRAVGPSELPRLHEIGLDPGVLGFALALSVLSGLLLGLLPLARAWRTDLVTSLKEGGRGLGAGRSRNRARNTLVVAQLALALVLLAGSGLMVRSFMSLMAIRPGYSGPEELLTFQLTIGSSEVPDINDAPTAHEQLARQIGALPGVSAVGLSSSIPMDGRAGFDPVFFEDFPLSDGQQPQIRRFKWVGGNYHETVGNPLVAGRAINWDDIRERTGVVMITESIARELWVDPARAVGRRLSTGYAPGDWREIVGVVGDVLDDGLTQDPVDIVYWPMAMDRYWPETRGDAPFITRNQTYVIRSQRVGTPGFLQELRDLVQGSYPDRPLGSLRTIESIQRESMTRVSFTLVMLGIAAGVALLLGAIGIYGVISYTVGQRTQELGLRVAMGAEPEAVARMVLKQGLLLAGVGVAVGVGAASGLTRLMGALLHGVNPVDPLTFGLVSLGLVLAALAATYLPARKAARVDPMVALRAE
jgi:predicted permease